MPFKCCINPNRDGIVNYADEWPVCTVLDELLTSYQMDDSHPKRFMGDRNEKKIIESYFKDHSLTCVVSLNHLEFRFHQLTEVLKDRCVSIVTIDETTEATKAPTEVIKVKGCPAGSWFIQNCP